ncbi:hypothetical protein [Kitasatospora terrestris]|uniref:DUF4229 domain-containing protein n=1 Tax=Kitasatospora terrestris TaxID=258051 RepID=A0ABP9DC12_9ACTN
MKMLRWVSLATVSMIATLVVLRFGFDLDPHMTAYISTGVGMALIFGRQAVVTRRQLREQAGQLARLEPVEWTADGHQAVTEPVPGPTAAPGDTR